MSPISKHKVIFDTDPGVDDAIALYFAMAHPAIELLGITTTFGNVSVEQATLNALYLIELAGRTVPVSQGVSVPWVAAAGKPPAHIHGADGLGNLASRRKILAERDPRPAAQFIVDTVRAAPGEVTIVAVGPLGNLALALMLEPRLPRMVRELVVMGGAVFEPGNCSPVAEANIWNDPHAAERVFAAEWPIAMVGLDVTHKVIVPLSLVEEVAAAHQHAATDTLRHAMAFYSAHYSNLHLTRFEGQSGCFAHDVLAFMYLVAPAAFKTRSASVRVVPDGLSRGQTLMKWDASATYHQPGWDTATAPARVCLDVEADTCVALLRQSLLGSWLDK